jgi:cytochrome c biogenesis protein CcmG/thiol:disulfide interchange protein DsbE
MHKLILLLPVVLFAVVLIAFGLGLSHDPTLLPSALIDRPAPDFNLPGLMDPAQGLAREDLGGTVTLINFFASWCAPCREEQAALIILACHPGITLDGITYKDKPSDSRHFLDHIGNPYHRVGVDRDGMTAINFGVHGVPETYVVDGTGHIRYRHVGSLSEQDVDRKILPLIAGHHWHEQAARGEGMMTILARQRRQFRGALRCS